MKKTLIFFALIIIFVSCNKYPEPDMPIGYGTPAIYSNNYILKEIFGKVKEDTIIYKTYYIELYFLGDIITENTYYTTQDCLNSPDPYCALPYEQKCFLNKIKNIEILANKPYRNQMQEITDVKYFFRNKARIYNEKTYYGEELGYSPMHIVFTEPPDSSQSFIFEIKITDDNNNIFTCLTDSVYIEKK
ncbi:MAG: hypothetical protein WAP54_03510 [Bacteroidales bacterium]